MKDAMKDSVDDDQVIVQYLLGALEASETERMDELSVTDDQFALRLQDLENNLVDDYARGDLTGPLLEQFKSSYLVSANRLEKVRYAQAFLAARQKAVAQTETNGAQLTPPRRLTDSASRPGWTWAWAAAAVVLVTVTSWLAVSNWRLREQLDGAGSQRLLLKGDIEQLRGELNSAKETLRNKPQGPVPSSPVADTAQEAPIIIALNLRPQLRGASDIPSLAVPLNVDYVTFQLDLESSEYSTYRAEVRSAPRQRLIWKGGIFASYDGDGSRLVAVTLTPQLLPAGLYVIELAPVKSTESQNISTLYPFRVVRK